MENIEIAAIVGAIVGASMSNRNRQNVIDNLKFQLKMEDKSDKKEIIQEEINRIELLFKKEKTQQRRCIIMIGIIIIMPLGLSIFHH